MCGCRCMRSCVMGACCAVCSRARAAQHCGCDGEQAWLTRDQVPLSAQGWGGRWPGRQPAYMLGCWGALPAGRALLGLLAAAMPCVMRAWGTLCDAGWRQLPCHAAAEGARVMAAPAAAHPTVRLLGCWSQTGCSAGCVLLLTTRLGLLVLDRQQARGFLQSRTGCLWQSCDVSGAIGICIGSAGSVMWSEVCVEQ